MFSYVYVGGTQPAPAGPASTGPNSFNAATGGSQKVESAIVSALYFIRFPGCSLVFLQWTYNPVTQDISMQWTNTDGSTVPAYLFYANDANSQ